MLNLAVSAFISHRKKNVFFASGNKSCALITSVHKTGPALAGMWGRQGLGENRNPI
jgi:hypothetical protein